MVVAVVVAMVVVAVVVVTVVTVTVVVVVVVRDDWNRRQTRENKTRFWGKMWN